MARFSRYGAQLLIALMIAIGMPSAVAAQDQGNEAAPFAGGIHQGPCDQLVVEPITQLEPIAFPPEPEQPPSGLESARPAATSTTPANWWLQDLLADPHSIVIYENAEQPQELLACGEIGGVVVQDELVIGLHEIEGSGVAGFAQLVRQVDNSTVVTVIVGSDFGATREPPAGEIPGATPVPDGEAAGEGATAPAGEGEGATAGERVEVEAVDIDFNPNELTLPANTDATIVVTNNGAVMHTFTIDELGIDEELQPGDTVEIAVNAEAGEYVYYCRVPGHREAGQEGTLTLQ